MQATFRTKTILVLGNIETHTGHDAYVEIDKHTVPGLEDENGYSALDRQQKPLEKDEQGYLTPILKPGAILVVEEVPYSEVQ